MELPQPPPFKAQGRKPRRNDFLSLCSHSTLQADTPKPTSSSSQGIHLKTHDFLQPLECVGGGAKEETSMTDTTSITSEKPHVLPGGIGTYTISSIPYLHNHQRVLKPKLSPPMVFTTSGGNERNVVDENSNSNSSSYNAVAANGFTLWDESGSVNKGQTRKENHAGERGNIRADVATTMGQLPVVEQRSQSLRLKSQSFMDMIRSAKGTSQDDDLDDEEDLIMKKESSSTSQIHRDLRVRADARGAGNNPKLNTPRSKHSATEQRRRSKINDRFQMLRQLIPNSDQKRDKASFLLEVIEYIKFLQDKTNKYETPNQGWKHESAKLLNWQRNNQQLVPEGTVAFTPKLEEEKSNIPVLATAQSVVNDHKETLNQAGYDTDQKNEEEEGNDDEVHEGNISISSVYSQGLVKRLREALEKSGVDLTKASISVEIELAKQSSSSFKDHEVCEPVSKTGKDDVKQTRKPKRLKTCNTS